MAGLDDIWNTLSAIPLQIAITILSAIFMPFVYVILHPLEVLYQQLATLINTIIALINVFLLLYNTIIQIVPMYMSFLPSLWSVPMLAGILMTITVIIYEAIKKYIPGWT